MMTTAVDAELAPAQEQSQPAAPKESFFVGIVLLITAIIYVGTIRFEFVYDDIEIILSNPFVKAWRFVPAYFTSALWKHIAPSAPGSYYRPLFLLLVRVNYAIFGTRPVGWHLVAISFHLLATWLTFVLAKKLTGRLTPAWLAALIFGIHPVHHEVVAWVTGSIESVFAVLFLAAFLAYLKSIEKPRAVWMMASCALYAAALLCKETAIVLPALVFAHGWLAFDAAESGTNLEASSRFKSALKPASFYLPVAVLYFVVRHAVFSGVAQPTPSGSVMAWLLTLPSILFLYVRHWFVPVRLSEFYDLFYQTNLSPTHVLLPLLALILLGGAVWFLRKKMGARAVGYAAAWMVIPLLPALDTFVFRSEELVHDRYFYVPSVGAALLVALFIERVMTTRVGLFGQPVHVLTAGFALAIVLAFFAARAATPWSSNDALYSRANQIAPLNSVATNNLGAELGAKGQVDRAQAVLEDGYRRHADSFLIASNLARVYYLKHEYDKAEQCVRRAIALAPEFADPYVTLARIQLRRSQPAEAQKNLRRAVELSPYNATFHTSYGIVLAFSGDCAGATRQFETSLDLSPGDALTTIQMLRCRASLSATPPPATKPGLL